MQANIWQEALADERSKPYLTALIQALKTLPPGRVAPRRDRIFRAFDITELHNVKAVILGNEPYPDPEKATGLCFSLPRGVGKTASIRRIHEALDHDNRHGQLKPDFRFTDLEHGDLSAWAAQGVLLLNARVAVPLVGADADSTRDRVINAGWKQFIRHVLTLLCQHTVPVAFMFWGSGFKTCLPPCINTAKCRHLVLASPHPASRGESAQHFLRGHHFSTANKFLRSRAIDWSLDAPPARAAPSSCIGKFVGL